MENRMNAKSLSQHYLTFLCHNPYIKEHALGCCENDNAVVFGDSQKGIEKVKNAWTCDNLNFLNIYGVRVVILAYRLLKAVTVLENEKHEERHAHSIIELISCQLMVCAEIRPLFERCYNIYYCKAANEEISSIVAHCASFIDEVLVAKFSGLEECKSLNENIVLEALLCKDNDTLFGNVLPGELRKSRLQLEFEIMQNRSISSERELHVLNISEMLEKHFAKNKQWYMEALKHFDLVRTDFPEETEEYMVNDIARMWGCEYLRDNKSCVIIGPNFEFVSTLFTVASQSLKILQGKVELLNEMPRRIALIEANRNYKEFFEDLWELSECIEQYEECRNIRSAFGRLGVFLAEEIDAELSRLFEDIERQMALLDEQEAALRSENIVVEEATLYPEVITQSCEALRKFDQTPHLFGDIYNALKEQNAAYRKAEEFKQNELESVIIEREHQLSALFVETIAVLDRISTDYSKNPDFYEALCHIMQFLLQFTREEQYKRITKGGVALIIEGGQEMNKKISQIRSAAEVEEKNKRQLREEINKIIIEADSALREYNSTPEAEEFLIFEQTLDFEEEEIHSFFDWQFEAPDASLQIKELANIAFGLCSAQILCLPPRAIEASRSLLYCIINENASDRCSGRWQCSEALTREVRICTDLLNSSWPGQRLLKRTFLNEEELSELWDHALEMITEIAAVLQAQSMLIEKEAELHDFEEALHMFGQYLDSICKYTIRYEEEYESGQLKFDSEHASLVVQYYRAAIESIEHAGNANKEFVKCPDKLPSQESICKICGLLRDIYRETLSSDGRYDLEATEQVNSWKELLVRELKPVLEQMDEEQNCQSITTLMKEFFNLIDDTMEDCAKLARSLILHKKSLKSSGFVDLLKTIGDVINELADVALERIRLIYLRYENPKMLNEAEVSNEIQLFINNFIKDSDMFAYVDESVSSSSSRLENVWKTIQKPEFEEPFLKVAAEEFYSIVKQFISEQAFDYIELEQIAEKIPESSGIGAAIVELDKSSAKIQNALETLNTLEQNILPEVSKSSLLSITSIENLYEYEARFKDLVSEEYCTAEDERKLIDELERLALAECENTKAEQKENDLALRQTVRDVLLPFGICEDKNQIHERVKEELESAKQFAENVRGFLEDFAIECSKSEEFADKESLCTAACQFAAFIEPRYGYLREQKAGDYTAEILCVGIETPEFTRNNHNKENETVEKLNERIFSISKEIDECFPEITVFCGYLPVRGKATKIERFKTEMIAVENELKALELGTEERIRTTPEYRICERFNTTFQRTKEEQPEWDFIQNFPVIGMNEIPQMPENEVPEAKDSFADNLASENVRIQAEPQMKDAYPEFLLWIAVSLGENPLDEGHSEFKIVREVLKSAGLLNEMNDYLNSRLMSWFGPSAKSE